MSNSTENTVIATQKNDLEATVSRENNSDNTESTAEHQEEHLESCPILTTQTNSAVVNNETETVSIAVQSTAGEDNVSENNASSSKKEIIFAVAKDLATCLAFILYISDIVSDVSVAWYYFSIKKIGYGCLILFFVYFASLINTAAFQRDSGSRAKRWVILIFNLSVVLIYGQIIYMLYKKWRKKDYCQDTLNSKQDTLRDTILYEGLFEGYPQILIQTSILSEAVIANEYISWLRYTSIVISTLGVTFTMIRFCICEYNLEITTNNIAFDKVIDFLCGLFFMGLLSLIFLTTAAAATSSGIIYLFIIPFIVFVLIVVLNDAMKCFTFVSERCFPCNLTSPGDEQIIFSIGIILTTICWYFTRNAVLWYWPLTFDFINYLSILYFVIGLVVTVLKIVNINLMYLKR